MVREIFASIVAPGHTDTEGLHSLGLIGSEHGKKLVSDIQLGSRFGQSDKDIAPVVVFLAPTKPCG
ncbi:hypothetical protein [Paenibacillus sp. yr247]|uniref:hypothetical protein n=1 Tax=Paenibacillus sp. yr247 TaxID=1761880 RepID=UPI000B881BC5|nr:hypothetical protein [Paenibacillus sp. yr247]